MINVAEVTLRGDVESRILLADAIAATQLVVGPDGGGIWTHALDYRRVLQISTHPILLRRIGHGGVAGTNVGEERDLVLRIAEGCLHL